ncbi:MAG: glutamyl-tRNA(Gln) amidotransferase subunit [Archaeoglobi archaeon]|nr:Glu-tRNA(Gln) amidotransferase subunit GatD [Candidatus Mnemosynella bozhongmuii]MDK2781478.1 glutamyl-tRNA(Gln) amidotransferase subunit [Archaeoglobi archaeon]
MREGDRVRVRKNGRFFEGILMPSRDEFIVIKLDNGYNIGISPEGAEIEVVEEARIEERIAEREEVEPPFISIISTGGTIASKVDYRTGAVTSKFSAEEILELIPELREISRFRGRALFNILSENMKPGNWVKMAEAVYEEIENGAEGIIITHGTDTMGYSSAALSFMLRTPVPVVFVGAQRSADRPSSDNVVNAVCAAHVAKSDIAEVTVAMHHTTSDDLVAVHRGTKVRKMHTSRRDAFKSVNASPVALVEYPSGRIRVLDDYRRRGEVELEIYPKIEERCALIKFYPGAPPEIIDYFVERNYRGIVIEGTGLGHVSSEWIPHVSSAVERGVVVVMTSQCLFGRVCDRVYDTGRDLLKAGVIEAEDMLPETALVKLMWLLGNYSPEETRKLMKVNIAGEINPRSRGGVTFGL